MKRLLSWQKALFSIGVDNENALELANRIFFVIFQHDFNVEVSPKNAKKKYHVA